MAEDRLHLGFVEVLQFHLQRLVVVAHKLFLALHPHLQSCQLGLQLLLLYLHLLHLKQQLFAAATRELLLGDSQLLNHLGMFPLELFNCEPLFFLNVVDGCEGLLQLLDSVLLVVEFQLEAGFSLGHLLLQLVGFICLLDTSLLCKLVELSQLCLHHFNYLPQG